MSAVTKFPHELPKATFLAIAQHKSTVHKFLSAGSFGSRDEVIDGENNTLLLVHVNHYYTSMHHNQPITAGKGQFWHLRFRCRPR